MSSTHSSARVARQPAVRGNLGRLGSQIEAAIESLDDQISETLDDLHRIRNSPTREAARISNPGILIGVATGPVARTMSSLPSAIPGPGFVLRRSSRSAAKVKEQYYDTTDPGFWATGAETDGQDLNPSHAAEAMLLLPSQPRSDPFNDAEMADSVREGWGVTLCTKKNFLPP